MSARTPPGAAARWTSVEQRSPLGTDVAHAFDPIVRPWFAGRRATICCLLAYAALALLAFAPASPLSTGQLPTAGADNPAGSDPFQMSWFLSYVPYSITHGTNLFYTNLIDYPQGVNVADNAAVPLLGILGWPVTASLGPIATFNLLIRLAFVLSATSMFFVLRRCCSTWQARF